MEESTFIVNIPFLDLTYNQLKSLYSNISNLPNYILDKKTKQRWYKKINLRINTILDNFEIQNGGNRKDKVLKFIEVEKSDIYYVQEDRIYYKYADRFNYGQSIEDFYKENRYSIECFYEKMKRLSPLTADELKLITESNMADLL